jgi:signal transduction histidine kinase
MRLEPSSETLSIVLECILSQTSDGIILLDRDDRICVMSAAAHHMLHIEGESMAGYRWDELPLRSLNDPSVMGTLARAVRYQRDTAVCPAPQQVATARGKTLLLTAMELPEDVALGNCQWRRLVILREVRTASVQLETLSGTAETGRSLQEETTDALAGLAQAIAHEVRNPVMIIGGFARILQRHYPHLEHIREILDNSQRLEAVVQEVADFASLPPVRFQDENPVIWLQEVLASCEEEAHQHHVKLGFQHSWPEGQLLCFDQLLMRKVVRILFENALQAMQGGLGEIRVQLSLAEDYACVEMVDTGEGIEPQSLPHIFGAFFTTKPRSLGMGLTKAERILAKHGGRLKVEPAEGVGTRVRLWIPLEACGPTGALGETMAP